MVSVEMISVEEVARHNDRCISDGMQIKSFVPDIRTIKSAPKIGRHSDIIAEKIACNGILPLYLIKYVHRTNDYLVILSIRVHTNVKI